MSHRAAVIGAGPAGFYTTDQLLGAGWEVDLFDALLTEHGLVHGGVFAGAAEAVASTGTALAVMGDGHAAMGLSNDTTVLADVRDGTIHLHARAVHRGEREWVLTVNATGDDERPLAHSRVTVAVRPLRRPA